MAKTEPWQQEINRALIADAMQGIPGQNQSTATVKPVPKTKNNEREKKNMLKEHRKNVEAVVKIVETTGGVVKGAMDMYGQGKRQSYELKKEAERSEVEIRKLRAEAMEAEGKARQEIGRARQEEAKARIIEKYEKQCASNEVEIFPLREMPAIQALPESLPLETVQTSDVEDFEHGGDSVS